MFRDINQENRNRRFRLLLVLIIVSLGCVWLAFAQLVVPPVIKSAYRGESLPVLNNTISGQAIHPVETYLQEWNQITKVGVLACVVSLLCVLFITRSAFTQRYVREATPGSLGAIRMLTCGILLTNTLWENLASSAVLPREIIQPHGMMNLFYVIPIGFEKFVASETALRGLQWATALCLFLGMIGWRTRIVIPLGAFCYF